MIHKTQAIHTVVLAKSIVLSVEISIVGNTWRNYVYPMGDYVGIPHKNI